MHRRVPPSSSTQSSKARTRTLRFLVLLSFFHFSGLNNGFTFMMMSGPMAAPTNFAPVAIQSLCAIVNPSNWKKAFQMKSWTHILTFSTRAIEVSSKNAIRKYHPTTLLNGIKGLGKEFMGYRKVVLLEDSPKKVESSKSLENTKPETLTINSGIAQSRPHVALRRTDERKPDEIPEVNLLNFNIQRAISPEFEIKANSLIERQASLPSAERLQLWRHARGVGKAISNIYHNGGFRE